MTSLTRGVAQHVEVGYEAGYQQRRRARPLLLLNVALAFAHQSFQFS